MGECRVDSEASREFAVWRDYWRKHGYPSIEGDLAEAFSEISRNHEACRCRQVARFAPVLQGYLLFKYRQKNKAAREGARGGWRIYALFDRDRRIVYPILVYPKKEWADASDQDIIECVRELVNILRNLSLY